MAALLVAAAVVAVRGFHVRLALAGGGHSLSRHSARLAQRFHACSRRRRTPRQEHLAAAPGGQAQQAQRGAAPQPRGGCRQAGLGGWAAGAGAGSIFHQN
jgi:hypothetical protein